eukprot:1159048-Pelagomonas_calceolata.AAC.4
MSGRMRAARILDKETVSLLHLLITIKLALLCLPANRHASPPSLASQRASQPRTGPPPRRKVCLQHNSFISSYRARARVRAGQAHKPCRHALVQLAPASFNAHQQCAWPRTKQRLTGGSMRTSVGRHPPGPAQSGSWPAW